MAIDFKIKKLICEPKDVWTLCQQLEQLWVSAVLKAVGIPQSKIDAKIEGSLSNRSWRDYLLLHFRVNIFKNLQTKQVDVFKIDENIKSIHIASWTCPTIVRVKESPTKIHCELNLKYWQLV